jgi:hypothetical protein
MAAPGLKSLHIAIGQRCKRPGSEGKSAMAVFMPLGWGAMAEEDPAGQAGGVAFLAAQAWQAWTGRLDPESGPDLAKARAVESGLLRRLMAAGHMPRPTKYQQHILAEFPQGTPAGILGEGVPFSLERARRLFVDEGGRRFRCRWPASDR